MTDDNSSSDDDNQLKEEHMIISAEFTNSSLISSAAYDPILESLKVVFKNGAAYEYCGVPRSVLDDMKAAPSAGNFFVHNIKGRYDFLKK